MKNYVVVALVACIAFVTLAVVPGHAQVLIKADVPFEFCAGHGVLPAGEYSIAGASAANQVLLLSSGMRKVELFMPNTTDWRRNYAAPSKLVFHRYGSEYFLAEIWTSDNAVRTLALHPRERHLAKAGTTPEVAVVYGTSPSASGN